MAEHMAHNHDDVGSSPISAIFLSPIGGMAYTLVLETSFCRFESYIGYVPL